MEIRTYCLLLTKVGVFSFIKTNIWYKYVFFKTTNLSIDPSLKVLTDNYVFLSYELHIRKVIILSESCLNETKYVKLSEKKRVSS